MVVPFAPGGSVDGNARTLAQRIGEILGQQVVVENIGGASGMTGSNRVARAAPDGYQLLMGNLGTHGVNQTLYKRPLYNAATDFAPVALVNQGLYVLPVRKDMPVVTLPEFIAYAKANQEKMHYGSGGADSTTHMVCILLGMATGIEATHVPYRGAGPALQDLVGGRLDYMCEPLPTALPQIQGNTLKPIVLLAPTRTQILPDLPSAAEQGLKDFRSRAGTRCSCQRARRTRSSVGSTPRPARRSILPTSVPGLRRRAPKFPRWSAGRRSTSVSSSRARSSNGRRRSRPAAC